MYARNIGALVVTRGNSILGVISEREIVHALSQYGEQVASMPIKEIMRHGLVTVAPEDDLNRVMKLMTRHRVRHMPVLRDGKLSGIIIIGDVVKHRLDDLELEANVLRDAITLTIDVVCEPLRRCNSLPAPAQLGMRSPGMHIIKVNRHFTAAADVIKGL
jgi:signal-transduction protein with cAMP-binding, CBS, and nucleotidyltransferase domain